jgi:hypothetical protein
LQSAAWESAELEELTALDEGVGSISTFIDLSLPGERLLFLLGVLQNFGESFKTFQAPRY